LVRLLEDVDVARIAEDALTRSREQLEADCPVDLYLMVGVGAANAGELVVDGRGIAFVCLEHFTGRPNPHTNGLGWLPPVAAVDRSRGGPRGALHLADEQSGAAATRDGRWRIYDYWTTGSRARLRELLVNEGVAVAASQAVAPGFEPWEYFGYSRRQYRRVRELDTFLRRAAAPELDRSGLGLRLRFLSGGMSPASRLVGGKVLPERSGYYLGQRMVESHLAERGLAASVRAAAQDFQQAEDRSMGIQTA
jgi:hypothetical protein